MIYTDQEPRIPLSFDERVRRIAARELVADAVRSGRLKREPCERCGEAKVEGHHDDYSHPLSVRWLCRTHHREVHRELGTPMGRPPRASNAGRPFSVRATDAEHELWRVAADLSGFPSVSAALRHTMTAWADEINAQIDADDE